MKPPIRAVTALLSGVLTVSSTGHAAEQTVTLRDWTGRGFAPEVIGYDVPAAGAADLRVTGADGVPVPVQIAPGDQAGRAVLLFPAELPKDATATYAVRDTGGATAPAEVTVTAEGETLVLGNALVAVRVPKPQQRTLAGGAGLENLPAPVLAFKGIAGVWHGAGKLVGIGQATALRVAQVATGPVRAEIRYELEFADGGYYRAVVRLDAREPVAEVREEYDLKGAAQLPGWQLDLAVGWQPQQAEWIHAMGNGGYLAETNSFAAFAAKEVKAGGGGYGPDQAPANAPAAARHVCRLLAPDSNWSGDQAQYVGLSADQAMAGVLTLHKGDWRRTNNLLVWSGAGGELAVQFPIGVRPLTWLNEVTSETSPFSMHEHDPALPATYGRRVWGLQLAAVATPAAGSIHGDTPFFRGKVFYGIFSLDRYKDLVLAWPDTKAAYPHVFLHGANLKRLRQEWQNSPLAEGLAKLWCVTGDEARAKTGVEELHKRLPSVTSYLLTTPALGHHHQYNWYWVLADDVLGWPGLAAADRDMLRARLALAAYLYADGDITSKGGGTHHGNPNMGVARQFSDAPLLTALLPDHPMNKAWAEYWATWCGYKIEHMTSAGGMWFEHGSAYQMHAFSKVNRAMAAWETLRPANLEALEQRLAATWRATLDQVTPVDPRVGARVWMGLHNSPPGFMAESIEGVGAVAAFDPPLAANLKWAWSAMGSDNKNFGEGAIHSIYERPWIAPQEPALGTVVLPGLGVVFRAHQGPDESWLFLRGGYHWSHTYADQGNFNFVSRGAVLVPWQPYQYYWPADKTFSMYNTVRLGAPQNESAFGWPDQTVIEHGFGSAADYARVSIDFPAWYIKPATQPGFGEPLPLAPGVAQTEGEIRHERQVVFLKGRAPTSPTYAVFRDTFHGPGRLASWLNLNLLGRQGDVQARGKEFTIATEFPLQLDLRFVQDQSPALETKEDDVFLAYSSGAFGDSVLKRLMAGKTPSPNWVRSDGKPADFAANLPDRERHVILRLAGQPGEEYHWVLFPRAKDEPAPTVTRLAPGVVKVVHREGTDWVFTAPDRLEFAADDVAFSGTAGAVRQNGDGSVTLQLLAGAGEVSYRGCGLRGLGPLERTVTAKQIKPGITTPPAPRNAIGEAVLKAPGEHIANAVYNQYDKDGVRIIGGRGAVRILADGKVRFSVPDAALVEMTCGTVGIRGMGPFDLTAAPDGWAGTVDGARRTLVMSQPENLLRPMLRLDGEIWASGIVDEPAPWRGRSEVQFAFAAGVEAGKQSLAVVEWEWPALPPVPPRRTLAE